ncbi:hypothetical protein T4D_908 [Trichinella pseudospiralis]|uniref:Uncharacterized protein n=1 Tax=Trichinella pseudospiralis TaxID=6337 RepID=A0A0V1FF64_TRIPS|nr:hypothetical protein T4D_908 [Trichinella pseudospiralis]
MKEAEIDTARPGCLANAGLIASQAANERKIKTTHLVNMQDGNKPPNKSVMFYFCQPSDTHVPGCVASKNKPPMNACVPQWTDTIKYEEEEEEEEDGSGPAKTDNTRAQSKWRETKMTTATTPNNAALIAVHSEVTSEASRPIIIIINTTIPSMLNDDNNNQASKSLGRPVSKLIISLVNGTTTTVTTTTTTTTITDQ